MITINDTNYNNKSNVDNFNLKKKYNKNGVSSKNIFVKQAFNKIILIFNRDFDPSYLCNITIDYDNFIMEHDILFLHGDKGLSKTNERIKNKFHDPKFNYKYYNVDKFGIRYKIKKNRNFTRNDFMLEHFSPIPINQDNTPYLESAHINVAYLDNIHLINLRVLSDSKVQFPTHHSLINTNKLPIKLMLDFRRTSSTSNITNRLLIRSIVSWWVINAEQQFMNMDIDYDNDSKYRNILYDVKMTSFKIDNMKKEILRIGMEFMFVIRTNQLHLIVNPNNNSNIDIGLGELIVWVETEIKYAEYFNLYDPVIIIRPLLLKKTTFIFFPSFFWITLIVINIVLSRDTNSNNKLHEEERNRKYKYTLEKHYKSRISQNNLSQTEM